MSSFTLRSPSPNQNRSTSTNRSGRSPERSSLGRKSVDLSNYSLKLGSPSDFSHRSSSPKHFSSPSDSSHKISNSNSRHTFSSQKENTERLSTPKGRSPVVTSQKGFMAPTISASSKGRSPVQKHPRVILSEQNQNPITKTEQIFSPNQNPTTKTEQISSQIQNPTKTEELFSPNQNPISKIEEVSSQILNPTKTEEISSKNQNPIKETAEAIISPYDPKTNYLSSRPQYLLYTPIPRIEMHKRGELDLFDPRNLEDSFSSSESDGSDETEETKTEADSSDIDLSKTGISIPGSSKIDLPKTGKSNLGSSEVDDLVQTEYSNPGLSECELQKTGISNPDSSETDLSETELQIPVLNAGATKRIKLKIAHLMVVLILGCIFFPLSDSPILNSDSNLKYPYLQFGAFDAKLMEISNRLSQWSAQSIQYFNKIFEREASFHTQIGGTFPLANLSLQILNESGDNLDSNHKPILNGFKKVERERFKMGNFESETGFGSEPQFESNKGVENQQDVSSVVNNELDNGFKSEPVKIENPIENINEETVEKVNELFNGFEFEPVKAENFNEETVVENINELDNGFESEPVKAENFNEETVVENINEMDNGFESEPVKAENINEASITKTDNEIDNGFESDLKTNNKVDNNGFGYLPVKEKLTSNPLMGIIIALLAVSSLVLISAAYVKKNRVSVSQPTNERATPVEEKPCVSNSGSGSSESLKTRASLLENSSVDMEMEFSTSFDRTNLSTGTSLKSCYSRERVARRESEVSTGTNLKNYSSERVARRESEVSSGSFGSFTSYEKIASKKVNGDEITTPVRRSSRIASKKD